MTIFIGCAGWSLRKEVFDRFPPAGTHLERYAARFPCVEINSSFYRPHRESTYRRWASSTPESFRFAVKLPKQITHVQGLRDSASPIAQFAAQVAGLEQKLGAVLVQLPPRLSYDEGICHTFFDELRTRIASAIVCEPRHASWFGEDAELMFRRYRIGRVAADPNVVPSAAVPGGDLTTIYYRWHGAPRMYYSPYDEAQLSELARQLSAKADATVAWCVFDNTAAGEAIPNGLKLLELVAQRES